MSPRRSPVVALVLAAILLTAVAVAETVHLRHQASLSDRIRVDWASWTVALVAAYAGLALVGCWGVARDRRRA